MAVNTVQKSNDRRRGEPRQRRWRVIVILCILARSSKIGARVKYKCADTEAHNDRCRGAILVGSIRLRLY